MNRQISQEPPRHANQWKHSENYELYPNQFEDFLLILSMNFMRLAKGKESIYELY